MIFAMAGTAIKQLVRRNLQSHSPNSSFISSIVTKIDGAGSTGRSSLKALALIGAGLSRFFGFATTASADEAEHGLTCPDYPWSHNGILSSYDHASAIAMPKMLNDGAVEYEDGTPATEAQMGKDVVSFLTWAAEPEMEERKLMGFKWIFVLSLALLQAAYYRRLRWSVLKSRKLVLDVVN
ncbi:unnamed protein product [Lupinus luteus]|uniref:Cytochrome c1 n=1 Tax=Lupinus luteus TaxID=3873 RepID=A0AAV1XIM0_LUPLU